MSADSVLKLNFFSHATLACRDLEKTRAFYVEFLGLDVVRTSEHSMMLRLGGDTVIVVVQQAGKPDGVRQTHNGLDVATQEDVARCHALVLEQQAQWGISRVTRPVEQHGTYSFLFVDLDGNWWEILTNPAGGYGWMFATGADRPDWGSGDDTTLNPNDYTRPRPTGRV